ncbi:MAG TPA: hypothetical protein VMZ28_15045, partial [Kofleriaceae bacterium]|nr:hypothetical protein [Kofleriaceae bacterium]
QLVRLARNGDWSAVASADAALSGLTLDGSRLTYIGESFGSVLGAQVLALDPLLGSAVLDVAGGGIIVDLVGTSAQFAQLLQPFVAGAFDLLVDVNSPVEAPLHAQMSLGLVQTVVEPGDGLALAPAGDPGKHVLFIEAYSDETVPNHATEALARAWNVVQVTLSKKSRPTRVVDFMKVAAPYTVTSGGGVRALVQLDPAAHPMITQQEGEQGYLPDFPPFVKRTPPIPVINPTEEVHALAVKWAESFRLTDTPTVIDP